MHLLDFGCQLMSEKRQVGDLRLVLELDEDRLECSENTDPSLLQHSAVLVYSSRLILKERTGYMINQSKYTA